MDTKTDDFVKVYGDWKFVLGNKVRISPYYADFTFVVSDDEVGYVNSGEGWVEIPRHVAEYYDLDYEETEY